MSFVVSYKTIDSTHESEKECADLEAVHAFLASMPELLSYYSVSDEHGDIDLHHYCKRHNISTGEGDICGQCEAEFDNYRAALNAEMLKHEYQLWFLCSKQYWFKCPVADFDSAKILYHSLNAGSVTGVRIARYDPEQGCESVLHKFN